MEWFRWYHGAASDSKWPIIARKSGQNIGTVVSVWVALLEYASQNDERGSIAGFDFETVDALYGYPDGTTETVCNTMRNKGLINNSDRIVSWSKRQPQREREDTSTERVRRFREKQKINKSSDINGDNSDETPGNATETQETPRTEQNRTEQKEDIDSSEAPPVEPSKPSPVILTLPLVGQVKEGPITQADITEWQALFPGIDVLQVCRTIVAWNHANPTRRKTFGGYKKHIVGWLSKEQDRGKGNGSGSAPTSPVTPPQTIAMVGQTKRVIAALDEAKAQAKPMPKGMKEKLFGGAE